MRPFLPLLSPRLNPAAPQDIRQHLQTCVIFNPAARGNKARHFRRHLDEIAAQCALKATSGPGDARRLAAQAVADGFDFVVAAGGDGTVNEVLNGLGDAPDGFARARLGVLPLGTINVFARELGIPARVKPAWAALMRNKERSIDLPWVEFFAGTTRQKRYFAQLAGAGLDARAIEMVSWSLKKKIGRLAYLAAGLKAMTERKSKLIAQAVGKPVEGELILVGNGRLYGGTFPLFPAARLDSGLLEVCAVPKMSWLTLFLCAPHLLLRGKFPADAVHRLRASSFTVTSYHPAAFELDGEWIGHLPATFGLHHRALRVAVP